MQKFNHAEAFCWMYYSSEDGTIGIWIFNSRDGVTPFMLKYGGVELRHSHWQKDLQQPEYKPKAGDLVWRTLTPQEAEDKTIRNIENHPEMLNMFDKQKWIDDARKDAEIMKHPCLAKVDEKGEFIKV
jgi:hypothetical protein